MRTMLVVRKRCVAASVVAAAVAFAALLVAAPAAAACARQGRCGTTASDVLDFPDVCLDASVLRYQYFTFDVSTAPRCNLLACSVVISFVS